MTAVSVLRDYLLGLLGEEVTVRSESATVIGVVIGVYDDAVLLRAVPQQGGPDGGARIRRVTLRYVEVVEANHYLDQPRNWAERVHEEPDLPADAPSVQITAGELRVGDVVRLGMTWQRVLTVERLYDGLVVRFVTTTGYGPGVEMLGAIEQVEVSVERPEEESDV